MFIDLYGQCIVVYICSMHNRLFGSYQCFNAVNVVLWYASIMVLCGSLSWLVIALELMLNIVCLMDDRNSILHHFTLRVLLQN